MPYIEKDTRDRRLAEFQLWEHEKAHDGISRCFARRFIDEIKAEFHDLPIGNTRQFGEDDRAIYDISRVA